MTRRSVIKWEVRGVLGVVTGNTRAEALRCARALWPIEDLAGELEVQSLASRTIGAEEARQLNDRAEA